MEDQDRLWSEAVRKFSDWAARNGLEVHRAKDTIMEPQFESEYVYATSVPYPDSNGVTFAKPTVATLMRRYVVRVGTRERLPGYGPYIEVHLVRHGRTRPDSVVVTPDELDRFGMEARHLDRID